MEYLNKEVVSKIQARQLLTEAEQLALICARDKIARKDYPSDEEFYIARSDYIDLLAQCIKYHQFEANVERQMIKDWVDGRGICYDYYKFLFADFKLWGLGEWPLLRRYVEYHAFHPEVEAEFVKMYLELNYGERKGHSLEEVFDVYCYHRHMQLEGKIVFIRNAGATGLKNLVNCKYFYLEPEAEAEFIKQRDRFTDEKIVTYAGSGCREYYTPKGRFDEAFNLLLKKLKEGHCIGLSHLGQEALLDSGYTELIKFHESYFGKKLYPRYQFEIDTIIESALKAKSWQWDNWLDSFKSEIEKSKLRPKAEQYLLKPECEELRSVYEEIWGKIAA